MATEGFKRKLAAIVSADVEGYSRLMGEDEESTVRRLTSYREAMANLTQRHRGRVVDSPGDNLLAEFSSVVDAVQCAVDIQRELKARNAELIENRSGDGVNVAARIEGLAEAGGICISGSAYDQIKNKLALGYEYLGEHAVKNIAEPVRVYRARMEPGAVALRVKGQKRVGLIQWHWVAIVVAALVGAGAVMIWDFYQRKGTPPAEVASVEKMAFPLPDKPSIAVLPFVNMSGDPDQEYFSDGITEDLITDLSKISGLFVIARNSTFTYKGKPVKIRQVAEELGVRYVLEGSVRRADDRVRINTQLIDATTGGHLWAGRYDGKMVDVFDLQDKITQKIVTALAVKLTPGEQQYVVRKETENTVAYDTLLKGWEHYRRFTPNTISPRHYPISRRPSSWIPIMGRLMPHWHRLIGEVQNSGIDGILASVFNGPRVACLGVQWSEGRVLARQCLQTAMNNPTSLAHQVASAMNLYRRQYEEAIAEAKRAIGLDPNDHRAHWIMAWVLIYAGSPEEAVGFAKTAMRLDPHYAAPNLFLLGLAHFAMAQLEEAVNMFERALTHNPELRGLSAPLAAAYAHLGRDEEARLALINYTNEWSWWGQSPNLLRVMQFFPFRDLEVADRLADGLLKAGLPGQPSGYCKVSQEDKLTGEEIRPLVFGRTITGFSPLKHASSPAWRIHRTKDGEITYQGDWPFSIEGAGSSASGKSWIEGDMLCDQWKYIFRGLKYHMAVYRNPEGTPEMKNQYLFVTDFGIFPWSPVD